MISQIGPVALSGTKMRTASSFRDENEDLVKSFEDFFNHNRYKKAMEGVLTLLYNRSFHSTVAVYIFKCELLSFLSVSSLQDIL